MIDGAMTQFSNMDTNVHSEMRANAYEFAARGALVSIGFSIIMSNYILCGVCGRVTSIISK